MHLNQTDFCFCTLALGKKYRLLAQQLAEDLAKNLPETSLVIYTDNAQDFLQNSNVLAYNHKQQGILTCYNDKRLVIAKALSNFRSAIFIDADTRIMNKVPSNLQWLPGITAGHHENLLTHVRRHNPERLEPLKKVAQKLNISLKETNYIGESLFIVTKDKGREVNFLNYWGMIAKYLELQGIHSGEGNIMGLAAAKVGWCVQTQEWQTIKQVTKHLDASNFDNHQTFWRQWKLRLSYHYRLNRARLLALRDIKFFYG